MEDVLLVLPQILISQSVFEPVREQQQPSHSEGLRPFSVQFIFPRTCASSRDVLLLIPAVALHKTSSADTTPRTDPRVVEILEILIV